MPTKKLPSRNVRGRIQKVASECSGSPLESIVIVTSAAPCFEEPATGEMPDTLPTFTPAILTSELGFRLFALGTIAWTVNGLENGLANLVKPP